MHSFFTPAITPGLSTLNQTHIEQIMQAAFRILEETGAVIYHPEMLSLLGKAGAIVEGQRVYTPRYLIQDALRKSPKGLMIFDQKGRPAMHLHGRKSYFGTSTASPQTRDALTGEMHETRLVDLEMGLRVADKLDNIDFVMPFGSAQDCPTKYSEAWEVLAVMKNTVKPMVFCPYSARGVEIVIEMAQKVAGGAAQLRRRPFAVCYPEPIAPLTWPEEVVDYMMICAKHHFPQLVTGAHLMGMTAPITLAGALSQALAESMLSTFMIQCVNPGAPVFMASIPCATNSRNGLVAMASPEFQLAMTAWADLARYVGLPTWGCAGVSDSHILDAQAGAESGLSILIQALAGVNLIHDVGYLGTGMQCSAAMLVFGNEIVGITKRILQGLTVTDDFLATEIINKVGPGGNFLTNKHTAKNLRSEIFTYDLFCKVAYDQWASAGAKSALELADLKVKKMLEESHPMALPEGLTKELEDFINAQ